MGACGHELRRRRAQPRSGADPDRRSGRRAQRLCRRSARGHRSALVRTAASHPQPDHRFTDQRHSRGADAGRRHDRHRRRPDADRATLPVAAESAPAPLPQPGQAGQGRGVSPAGGRRRRPADPPPADRPHARGVRPLDRSGVPADQPADAAARIGADGQQPDRGRHRRVLACHRGKRRPAGHCCLDRHGSRSGSRAPPSCSGPPVRSATPAGPPGRRKRRRSTRRPKRPRQSTAGARRRTAG